MMIQGWSCLRWMGLSEAYLNGIKKRIGKRELIGVLWKPKLRIMSSIGSHDNVPLRCKTTHDIPGLQELVHPLVLIFATASCTPSIPSTLVHLLGGHGLAEISTCSSSSSSADLYHGEVTQRYQLDLEAGRLGIGLN